MVRTRRLMPLEQASFDGVVVEASFSGTAAFWLVLVGLSPSRAPVVDSTSAVGRSKHIILLRQHMLNPPPIMPRIGSELQNRTFPVAGWNPFRLNARRSCRRSFDSYL